MDMILSDLNLLKKYDVYAFDYIEYPHKSAWNYDVSDSHFRDALGNLCKTRPESPLLLYVHIPFCEQLCYFCICHREITSDYNKIKAHAENSLFLEFDLLNRFFQEQGIRPNFKEIFLGGGSPTAFREPEFDAMLERLDPFVDRSALNWFAIEIDPRRADLDRLRFYHRRGINKLSFGIQDFDPDVQKAVNRVQPAELIEGLLTDEIREYFPSINFDLLVGLPLQTTESICRTIDRVLALAPDRISLTYVHYGPKFHPHQVQMNRHALLPDFYDRKRLFVEAVRRLLDGGYVRTGFEHFAKPDNEVARALEKRRAYYNSLGATEGVCTDIIATGRASYSTIGDDYYFQSVYEQTEYQAALEQGRFPILRGHKLSENDKIRRHIIKTLRTYFQIEFAEVEEKYNIDFKNYFKRELEIVQEFSQDGILIFDSHSITVTETGKHFANLIGSIFDSFVTAPRYNAHITRPLPSGVAAS